MTPRNPLDEKVILDVRDLYFASACVRDAIRQADQALAGSDYLRGLSVRLDQALAADLTGWAAVPVELTDDHIYVAWLNIDDDLESKTLRNVHRAMLEASPPLPGGGE